MTEYSRPSFDDGDSRSPETDSARAAVTRTMADEAASTLDHGAEPVSVAVRTETRRYRPAVSDVDALVRAPSPPEMGGGTDTPPGTLVESAPDAAGKRIVPVAEWLGSQAGLRGAHAKFHSSEDDAFSPEAPDRW